ncbi:universal stress protein [Flavobacterium sp. NG2]|uniref:universal stress protein n=1 Tax=Flavobacterium sp. NG2 TaxID=3097547 RepID=UPI002A82E043|nr:universal stress protein [Flavobacterium sp. NG2]WPR70666.1 universal stress protein [Flavobacterium sp. NG2]
MKRILFPTDFSEVATNAFVHALEFAKVVEGELILLHSYDLPPMDDQFFPENFTEVYDTVELAHFDLFKEELPKLREIIEEHHFEHIKMTHRLMEGNLVANIKKCIDEEAIDYLVMGTSGATDWETLFSGTNSGSVILGINVPMLCVPFGVEHRKIKTIGFVTHYRPKDKLALKKALELAKIIDAKVKCLYIKNRTSQIDIETIKEWELAFKDEPVEYFMFQSDEIKQVTLGFVEKEKIDVLSILTYKSGFFEGMFVANYAEKTTEDIKIPVLVIHA